MYRIVALCCALFFVAACENIDDISGKPKPIGEFALGHNIVVAPNLVMGPVSREASKEEWIASVTKAIGDRFERYEGEQLYHFGVSLEGYVLAQPGIPVLLSPKSALILKLTVWDDAAGKKLNEEPEQITVLETLDGDTLVGSGLTKTAEEQMETLSLNAAKLIQRYIQSQHLQEKWFKKRKPLGVEPEPALTDEAAAKATETETQKVTEDKEAAKAVTNRASTTEKTLPKATESVAPVSLEAPKEQTVPASS